MNEIHEVTISDVKYRTAKMSASDQANLLRRFLPIFRAQAAGRIAAAQRVLDEPRAPSERNGMESSGNGADTPANGDAGPAAEEPFDPRQSLRDQDLFLTAMQPTAEVLSKMSDEDFNYLVRQCLAKTQRYEEISNSWRAMGSTSGQPMFEDMDAGDLMELTWEVAYFNLGPSLRGRLPRVLGIDLVSQ